MLGPKKSQTTVAMRRHATWECYLICACTECAYRPSVLGEATLALAISRPPVPSSNPICRECGPWEGHVGSNRGNAGQVMSNDPKMDRRSTARRRSAPVSAIDGRTVKPWEATLGLPVRRVRRPADDLRFHRHLHGDSGFKIENFVSLGECNVARGACPAPNSAGRIPRHCRAAKSTGQASSMR